MDLSTATEEVPELRALECRAAIARGDRDGALAAAKLFLPVDPLKPRVLLDLRQWLRNRADNEGVRELDLMVDRFCEDRLLLMPDYPPYLRELDRWRNLTQ